MSERYLFTCRRQRAEGVCAGCLRIGLPQFNRLFERQLCVVGV
jgi:hypothetical protein